MSDNKKEFHFEVNKDFDFVIEEASNTSICLRKISWGGREEKLDLRKYSYSNGEERMLKGVSLSEEGGNELANVLVDNGYGDTKKLIKSLKSRGDYYDGCEDDVDNCNDDGEYYDPSMLIS